MHSHSRSESRWAKLTAFRACLLIGALALPACAGRAEERLPNIVFILADDLGWADLACYGADLHETPHLDRLASQGIRFTDAYAAAPICSPTRASIMTGKYPARLHMTIWYEGSKRKVTNRPLVPPITVSDLPHREVTIAEVLQEAGYRTAHVGKWHLGDAAHYPQTQGFDVNVGGTFWGAPPTYFYPYRGFWGNSQEFRYVPHLHFGKPGEYLTDRLTDEAITVIEQAGDDPFFLYLAYHTVHTPIEAKRRLVERYRGKLEPGFHHQNPAFAAMVHSLDENVGRILARLEELDLADDTIVVLTSDNGGYVNKYKGRTVTNNSPLRSGKGSLYEGGIRVPLIVRWPRVAPAGRLCRAPVCSTDFYGTILEMTGLTGKAGHNKLVDGISLVPLLRDPDARLKRDALFFHYPHYYPTTTPVSAVRAGDWKLLEYFEDDHVELYDLKNDPGETNDLAEDHPEKALELRERLDSWREEVNAQLPTRNPRFETKAGRK